MDEKTANLRFSQVDFCAPFTEICQCLLLFFFSFSFFKYHFKKIHNKVLTSLSSENKTPAVQHQESSLHRCGGNCVSSDRNVSLSDTSEKVATEKSLFFFFSAPSTDMNQFITSFKNIADLLRRFLFLGKPCICFTSVISLKDFDLSR